ncbi:MAG: flavodoxin family protein [Chloroflexota bacterium]
MKVLIVYDSVYGNTEKIARAIGGGIAGEVKVARASEVGPDALKAIDLLIVGAPTQGGRPTPAVRSFLSNIEKATIRDIKVAAFDTRLPAKWVKIFGYAAGKIAGSLKGKGGTLAVPPEGFFVNGTRGPLQEGETERAARWAKGIVESK